jgi:hypothetical protein
MAPQLLQIHDRREIHLAVRLVDCYFGCGFADRREPTRSNFDGPIDDHRLAVQAVDLTREEVLDV